MMPSKIQLLGSYNHSVSHEKLRNKTYLSVYLVGLSIVASCKTILPGLFIPRVIWGVSSKCKYDGHFVKIYIRMHHVTYGKSLLNWNSYLTCLLTYVGLCAIAFEFFQTTRPHEKVGYGPGSCLHLVGMRPNIFIAAYVTVSIYIQYCLRQYASQLQRSV